MTLVLELVNGLRRALHRHLEFAEKSVAIASVACLLLYFIVKPYYETLHPVIGFFHSLLAVLALLYLGAGWFVQWGVRKTDIVGLMTCC
jgi:hypothetical protein